MDKKKPLVKVAIWISVFSIAMAYLESAVVIYLRELYFPEGFAFPMKPISNKIAVTEFIREIATLVMLLTAAYIAGRNAWSRFAWFCWCFGVWDIFYYIWLKVLIDWPASLLEWDILFLVPIPWTGPVLAPVIISLGLILIAVGILGCDRNGCMKLKLYEHLLLYAGALIIIISFCWDHYTFAAENGLLGRLVTIPGKHELLFGTVQEYIPKNFPWWIFIAGVTMTGWVAFKLMLRSLSGNSQSMATNNDIIQFEN